MVSSTFARFGILRRAIAIILAIWLASLFSQPAFAGKRVALVIGNSKYEKVGELKNPVNDAKAVAVMLNGFGFDVVEPKLELKAADMRRELGDFFEKVSDADIAIVYFAGHGMEISGTNHLIPVDAVLARDTDVEGETVSLDRILTLLEPAKQLRLVILDACRDNPFARTMKRTLVSRGSGKGLAKVEPSSPNTLVAYAAKAGTTASDGDGEHSPFTAALIKYLPQPGLDVRLLFGSVRDEVLKTTKNKQEPHIYGSLGGSAFPLVPGQAATSAPDADVAIRSAYESAKAVGTKDAWEAFLSAYPSGFYAKLARIQLHKLLADEAAQRAAEEAARLAREGATAAEQAKAAAQAKATADAAKKAANAAKDAAAAQPKGSEMPLNLCGEGYRLTAENSCERVRKNRPSKSAKTTPSASRDSPAPRNRPATPAPRQNSGGYNPQGSGAISDGSCNCKKQCNQFAAAGQLAGAKLSDCKAGCQQRFPGCNVGVPR
jgi:uncharacterized caspase-like protein